MVAKSRHVPRRNQSGEQNANAKLADAFIPAIRDALAGGEYQRVIATRYGVSQSTISRITNGRAWRNR
jgi:DNA invertase Pin-like site-specific DNA recombinase